MKNCLRRVGFGCSGVLCRLLFVFAAASFSAQAREEVDLGFGWRFAAGPRSDAVKFDCMDGEPAQKGRQRLWRNVDLPHDFQFEYPWDENASRARGYKTMGVGCYRRHFFADPAWRGKRVALDFEGVLCCSEIWLNGDRIAEDDYGYLGFEVDVSRRLRWGETNVVAVIASTGNVNGSRWYTGGGLYRGVKLVVRNPISVARHGVFVTTPVVTADTADINVEVDIDGFTRCTDDLAVSVTVLSPEGRKVCRRSVMAPKDCRSARTRVTVAGMTVDKPQRWDIDAPALYEAEVSLVRKGEEIDRVKTRFGIRTIEFGPSFGFRLNGRKVFLQSMCNHHDLGAVGAAAYPRAIERQFRIMKEFGFNAIRCAHNPYSKDFLDLADRLGVLVVDELADNWSGRNFNMGRPMTECFFPRITEWVKRSRNHPSVILRSLGNELQHDEERSGFPSDDWGVTTYRIFDTVAKRWDPSRKTTVAMYPASDNGYGWREAEAKKMAAAPRLALETDVASFNYVWRRYPDFFRQKPDLILFQSEAVVRELLAPYWGMDRERTVGLSYWGAIEYWGESPGWPAKGWNYSFFGHDLTPRPTAYLVRSAFKRDEPLVHLAVFDGGESRIWNDVNVGRVDMNGNWNRKVGEKVRLVAFTNADEAELFINGKSFGVRRNDASEGARRNILSWENVEYIPGKAEVVARNGPREVSRHALETAGDVVGLVAEPESGDWKADGYDLLYVRVRAVDAKGLTVPSYDANMDVRVEGPATLIALDEGNHSTSHAFNVSSKRMRNGSLLGIFRAGRHAGDVKIAFESDCEFKAECKVRTTVETESKGCGKEF